jgi:hypothetical protein
VIILDSTLKSLEAVLGGAVTTNQLPFVAAYVDAGAAQPLLENDGLTNSTTAVTLAAAPAASVVRIIKGLSLVNLDTVAATATIRLNNNGTLRTIFKTTLAAGDVLIYDAEGGFRVFDSSGTTKAGAVGTPHALLDGSVNNDTLAGAPTRGAVIVANSTPAWAAKAIGAIGTLLQSDGTDTIWSLLADANVAGAAAIAWSKISKAGSSLADLATRSASDLSSGTLPDARFPATLPAASGVNLTALNGSNVASGTVAPARLGSGSGGATKFLREDSTYQNVVSSTITPYTATLADVLNTATETAFLSFTVGANVMNDGDVIEITMAALIKNNKGSNGTATLKAYWGSANVTLHTPTWFNIATEFIRVVKFIFMRVGTELWSMSTLGASGENIWSYDTALAPENTSYPRITGVDFTISQTVAVKLTFSAADALFYCKPQVARVIQIKAS